MQDKCQKSPEPGSLNELMQLILSITSSYGKWMCAKSSEEENKNTLTLPCTRIKMNQGSEGEKERRKVYTHKGKRKLIAMGTLKNHRKVLLHSTLLISCMYNDTFSA